jgi:hypothetical protein
MYFEVSVFVQVKARRGKPFSGPVSEIGVLTSGPLRELVSSIPLIVTLYYGMPQCTLTLACQGKGIIPLRHSNI